MPLAKPVAFDPYGSRRRRRGLPRWLLLLSLGVVLGVAGVLYVQQKHLPPRLSAQESTQLRAAYDTAEAERLRLKGELDATARQLDTALAEKKALTDELAASRTGAEKLRNDNLALVGALPPDPRGGGVSVRAATFTQQDGKLVYDVVLSRPRAGGKPYAGVMQLLVTGAPAAGGPEITHTLPPITVSVGAYETLRGSLPLPEGFKPRQATIRVADRPGGDPVGMRVMYVQ